MLSRVAFEGGFLKSVLLASMSIATRGGLSRPQSLRELSQSVPKLKDLSLSLFSSLGCLDLAWLGGASYLVAL